MPITLLASFPNSRIKPRPSTQAANTYQVTLDHLGNPITKIAFANLNRTYIALENLSQLVGMWYVYVTEITFNPSLIALNGVPEQLAYDTVTQTLYQKQDVGVTTNWVVVLIQNVGEFISPLQTASLESLEPIYGAYNSTPPVGPPTPSVGVDEGRG
jgi:hypothetical protein